MPQLGTVNFKPVIKRIQQDLNPSISITAGAVNVIDYILNNLNKTLVSICRREQFLTDEYFDVMRAAEAIDTVNHVFTGTLKEHAEAEGNKWLIKYNGNRLDYQPPTKTKAKEVKAEKERIRKDFFKGISSLSEKIAPEGTLQNTSKQMIGSLLASISEKISRYAKSYSQPGKIVNHHNVKTAVETILPEEMNRHALSEGAKMMFLYESGNLVLPPSKRSLPKPAVKTKKTSKVSTRKRRASPKSRISPEKPRKRRKISKTRKRLPSSKRGKTRKTSPKRPISKSTVTTPRPTRKKRISPVTKGRISGTRKSKRGMISKIRKPSARTRKIEPKRARKISPKKSIRKRPTTTPSSKRPRKRSPKKSIRKRPTTAPSSKRPRKTSPKKSIRKRTATSPSSKRPRKTSPKKTIRKRAVTTSSPKRPRKTSPKTTIRKRLATTPSSKRPRKTSPKKSVRKRPTTAPSPKRPRTTSPKKTIRKRPATTRSSKRPRKTTPKKSIRKRTATSPSSKRPRKTSPKKTIHKRTATTPSPKRPRKTTSKKTIRKRTATSPSFKRPRKTSPKKSIRKRAATTPSPKRTDKRRKISEKRTPKKGKGKVRERHEMDEEMESVRKSTPKLVAIAPKDMKLGIKKLNVKFEQSLVPGGLYLISSYLAKLADRIINNTLSQPTIGYQEIREAVIRVFPEEIRGLALAHMSKALTDYQY